MILEKAKIVYGDDKTRFKNFLEQINSYGRSALSTACQKNNAAAVNLLINTAKELYADDPTGLNVF